MARSLSTDDTVYVPWARLGDAADHPSAFWKGEVAEVRDRSVKVTMPGAQISDWVASSAVHRNIGILIVEIGDFDSEAVLLKPLAKSVLHFCRLLVSDAVRLLELRTLAELKCFWRSNHGAYRHVILVGHGDDDGIAFSIEGTPSVSDLVNTFVTEDVEPKIFISLCCRTGFASFAKPFSNSVVCEALIAPFHSIHGAVASQFCQTFLAHHLLDGRTTAVAYKSSADSVPGGKKFRLWRRGALKAGS